MGGARNLKLGQLESKGQGTEDNNFVGGPNVTCDIISVVVCIEKM